MQTRGVMAQAHKREVYTQEIIGGIKVYRLAQIGASKLAHRLVQEGGVKACRLCLNQKGSKGTQTCARAAVRAHGLVHKG